MLVALLLACAATPNPVPSVADHALSGTDDCAVWDERALQLRLDRKTRSVERPGNRAEILENGDSFQRRFDNARDAELILAKTFIFTDDETGRAVAELMKERARAGATVILQYDLKGSLVAEDLPFMIGSAAGDAVLGDKPLLSELRAAGVIVIPTNVPRGGWQLERWLDARERAAELGEEDPDRIRFRALRMLRHFDHEKYWITGREVDGELELRAILGGTNIASEYAYGGSGRIDEDTGRQGWRDTDVELRGPVVNDIVERYFDLIELHGDTALDAETRAALNPPQQEQGEARVRFVWNQPSLGNRRSIQWLYWLLAEATPPGGIVRIEVAYFVPGWRTRRHLARAFRQGTRLSVLTNSEASIDVPFVVSASRNEYAWILKRAPASALYEWQPVQGMETLHSKVASFGSCGPVIIGSANLDAQSSEHNSEGVVMIRDPGLRADFDAMFQRDVARDRATRVTVEEVERTPWWRRLQQIGVYRLGWIFLDG